MTGRWLPGTKHEPAVEAAGTAGTGAGPAPGSELRHALASCRGGVVAAFVFSAISNLLMLTGAIYMLEVYDRVLPSRSVPTLVALSLLAVLLFTIQGLLDAIRSRVLIRIGAILDAHVGERVVHAVMRLPQRPEQRTDGMQPIRDIDAVRGFCGSPGPIALMDMPWLPFYVAIVFAFHPLLGMTALGGAVLLIGLTLLTEWRTRGAVQDAVEAGQRRLALAEASRRNADAALGMGMSGRLATRYTALSEDLIDRQNLASDVSGGVGGIARMLRLMLQSAMLGLGAWLVIQGEASAGVIIAGSILVGRALAPVDQAIAHWKGFIAARDGWRRLKDLLQRVPPEPRRLELPAPRRTLKLERVAVPEPGGQRVLVHGIDFELPAGSGLAIIGPSGSGKSTLARAMVGAWPLAGGRVRLDGAALDQWPGEQLGRHIGYLPQDVELFAGTVAENIARLDPNPPAGMVISAALAAGCHDMILNLRDGYQTQVGEGGAVLSAGQRQRVALARALHGDPFLVVLDEPNAHLDSEGDRALQNCIRSIRERGGIAIVISHRHNALDAVDHVLIMKDGQPAAFGPRDAVLARFLPGLVREKPQDAAAGPRQGAGEPSGPDKLENRA